MHWASRRALTPPRRRKAGAEGRVVVAVRGASNRRARISRVSLVSWVSRVVGLGCLILTASGGPAGAQPGDRPDAVQAQFAYLADSGFGGFSVSGRSVQVYRIPFSYPLRPLEERRWGLKLTLPVSFGVHNLKAIVGEEVQPLERLRTMTFVPGVELQLPVGGEILIKPFAEAGFGRETEASGATVYLYSAGVKTLTTRRRDGIAVSLGTNVEWNGVSGEEGEADDFGLIEVGVEAQHPLPMSLSGRRMNVGPYVTLRYFCSDLVFERIGGPAIGIDGQVELGVSLGTEEPLRVLGVKLPRLGVAYRFGDGLESWRINFGFPF